MCGGAGFTERRTAPDSRTPPRRYTAPVCYWRLELNPENHRDALSEAWPAWPGPALWLCGCGGASHPAALAQRQQVWHPAATAVRAGAGAPPSGAARGQQLRQRCAFGAAFDLTLPLQQVGRGFGGASFAPATVPAMSMASWPNAVYSIDARNMPARQSCTPSGCRTVGRRALAGLCNYSTDRWNWFNPANTSLSTSASSPNHRTATGKIYVAWSCSAAQWRS